MEFSRDIFREIAAELVAKALSRLALVGMRKGAGSVCYPMTSKTVAP